MFETSQEDFKPEDPHNPEARWATKKEALKLLSDFEQVVVAGGGALNASFVEENLVDEIYLDIEPIILGKGITLFRDKDFERKLKLLGQ